MPIPPDEQPPHNLYLPDNVADMVIQLVWLGKYPEARHLAEKASLVVADQEQRRYFRWAMGYAGAIAFWHHSWDYGETINLFQQAVAAFDDQGEPVLIPMMLEIVRAEVAIVRAERQWMLYDIPAAFTEIDAARRSYQAAIRESQALVESGYAAFAEHLPWADLVKRLGEVGLIYADCEYQYLSAYRELLQRGRQAASAAKKALQFLDHQIADLVRFDDAGDAQEIHAFRNSLEKRLELATHASLNVHYHDVNLVWTFRRSYPVEAARMLYRMCAAEQGGEGSQRRRQVFAIEQRLDLPVIHITPSLLNDIFTSKVGEDNFLHVELAFPAFSFQAAGLPEALIVTPMARIYTAGVLVVLFEAEELTGDLMTHQVQQLRFSGSSLSPKPGIRVDWLSPEPFGDFADVADAIAERLAPLARLEGVSPPPEAEEEADPEAEWLYFMDMRALRMTIPEGAQALLNGCELAAISNSLQESYDSIDPWMNMIHDPERNLAGLGKGLANTELFFISDDHVFIYGPITPDWLLFTYQDLIDFTLNLSTMTGGVLTELDAEIHNLRETMRRYDFRSSEPRQMARVIRDLLRDQEKHGLRMNQLKARVLEIRNLYHLSSITRFDEYRMVMEKTAEALNVAGALQQAENLVETLLETHKGLNEYVQRLHQEMNVQKEQFRSRAEGIVVLIIQILGISQIVSSIVSLLVIADADVIHIPWLGGSVITTSGAALKAASLIGFLIGIAAILLMWFLTFSIGRKRKE